jgi:hypothetical protein
VDHAQQLGKLAARDDVERVMDARGEPLAE